MTNATQDRIDFSTTEPARILYEDLLEPYVWEDPATKAKGKPVYTLTVLMKKDGRDFKTLHALVGAELQKLFPGKKCVARRLTQEEADAGNVVEITVPWEDGDKKADAAKLAEKDAENCRGFMLVKSSSIFEPVLSTAQGGKVVEFLGATRTAQKALFYPGVFVAAFYTLNAKQSKKNGLPGGIGLYVNSVFSMQKGERLGGKRRPSSDVFKAYAGTVSDVDPTAGLELDDEIPF